MPSILMIAKLNIRRVITYFDIENGTCLLRRTRLPGNLGFDLMSSGTVGQWKDGTNVGVRYTVECSEIECDEISIMTAGKLAKKFGGVL